MCFDCYRIEGGHAVTRALFEANPYDKVARPDFCRDMDALLRHGLSWDFNEALGLVLVEIVVKLPGEP